MRMLDAILKKTKLKLKKETLPTAHPDLFRFSYLPQLKVLWMDVLNDVDLDLCVFFMQDAIKILDQSKEPFRIVYNLTQVKKFDASCTQCFQTKELPLFMEHPQLAGQIFIGAPPYIKLMIDLSQMFTVKTQLLFKTEEETLHFLQNEKKKN